VSIVARVLAILLLSLSVWRGWLLTTGRERDAPGEKKWWPSVYHGDVGAKFLRARSELVPGESVNVVISPPGLDPNWWRTMARYYLIEQNVEEVMDLGAAPPPPGRTVSLIDDSVRVEPPRR
jgi:hypothetical protein